MYFNRRAFLHNCTLTEVKNIRNTLFAIHTNFWKGRYAYNISSIEIISTDKLHSVHFISPVLKYMGKCFKWQHTVQIIIRKCRDKFFNRNSLTVTSYENALEQALQSTYVTRSHELSLNSHLAYCATGKSSQWGSIWVFSGFCKIKALNYKH